MDYTNIFSITDFGKKGHEFMFPKFLVNPDDPEEMNRYKNGKDYLDLFFLNMKGNHLNFLQKIQMIEEHFKHSENKKMFLIVLRGEVIPKLKKDGLIDLSKAILEYLEDLDPQVSKPKTDPSVLTPLARHWALFFAYLNPSVFDVKPTIEKFCEEHKVNVTAENVRQQYYKREYNNPKKRAISDNVKDIQFVITHFLKNCPEKTIAENELKTIECL